MNANTQLLQQQTQDEVYRLNSDLSFVNRTVQSHPEAIDYSTACMLQNMVEQATFILKQTEYSYLLS